MTEQQQQYRTVYRTYVEGRQVYEGESLETAIRTWDGETYLPREGQDGRPVPGGIAVATYLADGTQTRDGWILHVHDNGVVYLSPRLREQ